MATKSKMYVVANRYAKALWLLSTEDKKGPETARSWIDSLETIAQAFETSKDLRNVMSNAAVSSDKKGAIAQDLFKTAKAPEKVLKFGRILAEKGRLPLMPEIVRLFTNMTFEQTGEAVALVETASELSPDDLKQILQLIEKQVGKKAVLKVKVNPELLAGFRVTVAGKTLDGTLSNHLLKLKKQLLEVDTQTGVKTRAAQA